MSDIAVMLGCLGLTTTMFYLSYRHNLMGGMYKVLAPFFHIVAIWTLGLPLLYISNNGAIDPLGDVVLIMYLVVTIMYTLIYSFITVITNTAFFLGSSYKKTKDVFKNG